jgi:hypothetical protein
VKVSPAWSLASEAAPSSASRYSHLKGYGTSMIKKGLRRREVAFWAAIAIGLLLTLGTSPTASASTMRTLNLSFSCTTGPALGLYVSTGGAWSSINGSGDESGDFTISIPASATTLQYEPATCDNQDPSGELYSGPDWSGYSYNITAGTSTINANGSCLDYIYSYYGENALLYYCSLSSITYG